ncbi:MAG TPA: Stp1/IreP family PP2C-type Ser/Thr phosphatase [Alloiococcus sp.]|nr:Stp1/IreP family PP2C-type Ser/Thr phosphatase [Alloiococcus sp.]
MQISIESIKGRRGSNQDCTKASYNKNNYLMAVLCDGMGGHQAGDHASQLAVETITNMWEETTHSTKDEIVEWVNQAINQVNQLVYETGIKKTEWFGMGSTIVAGIVVNDSIIIANVGDSRAYQYNENGIQIITNDHSFAHELYLNGEITKKEAEEHVQRNMLTRSLGLPNDVSVDIFELSKANLSKLFLCSDGLSDTLSKKEMMDIIEQDESLDFITSKMVEQAYQNGSTDNITVLMIDFKHKQEGGI